ncbi:MAG TPA: YfiR family protein, partial [Cyclobacteriaceae bacterium]
KTIGSKMINGLPVRVTQTENITDIDNQEVVYLSDGKSSLLDDLLKSIAHKSIMVITEREGLFKKGAGFSFILTDNNTLRFDINNTELEKRQIKVSKSLTSLANTIL